MWSLLSHPSRERLGPGEGDFERKLAKGFRRGLGSFAGTGYATLLSVETPSGWGVAAIAGRRVRDGKPEFAAYAAALRREGGVWKLELGDPVRIAALEPPAGGTVGAQPRIRVRLTATAPIHEAGVWLDGATLPARIRATTARDIRIEAEPVSEISRGWHVTIVFGRAGDQAAAGAAPFRVDARGSSAPVA
jgi:hypothetical protein